MLRHNVETKYWYFQKNRVWLPDHVGRGEAGDSVRAGELRHQPAPLPVWRRLRVCPGGVHMGTSRPQAWSGKTPSPLDQVKLFLPLSPKLWGMQNAEHKMSLYYFFNFLPRQRVNVTSAEDDLENSVIGRLKDSNCWIELDDPKLSGWISLYWLLKSDCGWI